MATYIRVSNMHAGQPKTLWQKIGRTAMLVAGGIVGLGVLILATSAALIVVLAILVLAAIAFVGFWIRAKVFGKTVREKAFEDLEKKFGVNNAQFETENASDFDGEEIVLDARETPDGWTVGQ